MDVVVCTECGGSVEREFAEIEGNTTCSGCLITAARLLSKDNTAPSYNEILGALREPKKKASSKKSEE